MLNHITPMEALIDARRVERFFRQVAPINGEFDTRVIKVERSPDGTEIFTTIVSRKLR